MSLGPGSLNLFLPLIERLTRLPGRLLVIASGLGNLLLLLISWQTGTRGETVGSWIPFGISVVFTLILLSFAIRRARLERLLDQYTEKMARRYAQQMYNAGELPAQPGDGVVIDEDGTIYHVPGMEDEARRFEARQRQADAERAASIRKDTFLSSLEAAQRAAIAQAGGIENVPHLKDDLRWTILSAGITAASMPVIVFLTIVALLMLI